MSNIKHNDGGHGRFAILFFLAVILSAIFLFYPNSQSANQKYIPFVPANPGELSPSNTELREMAFKSRDFLLRSYHKDTGGFYKIYYPESDIYPSEVNTVYSASSITSLIKINDYEPQPHIEEMLSNWTGFLLSMQSRENGTYGAFHYSYDFTSRKKLERFPVGTSALTSLVLLDMYDRTNNASYLESAELAGAWLVSMQKSDGSVYSLTEKTGGQMRVGKDISVLYNGQTLSALSKIYIHSPQEKFSISAKKLRDWMVGKIKNEGCYLSDDYRTPNPISSGWGIMSLISFYDAEPDAETEQIIMKCGEELVGRQIKDETDPINYGRWQDSYSTSGTGWLGEVMMATHAFCLKHNGANCGRYLESARKASGWIIRRTYTSQNSAGLPDPANAEGGIYWDSNNGFVRLDVQCHAMNTYVLILEQS